MSDWSGWIPVGVDRRDSAQPVLWFRLGAYGFDDAYFSETVARCARHPFNLAFSRRTGYEELEEIAQALPPADLSGLIFHLSRCGSTLTSRCLSSIPGTLVISEAPPVDSLVRDRTMTQEQQVRRLRALARIFAAAGGPHQRQIWKLDAWHTLNLDLFERAFPGVPWIYLYREPVEVLVSHGVRMSYMMSPANAPDFLGISLVDAMRIPRAEYCARVLGAIAAPIAEREAIDRDALVRYDELPQALWERIAPRFGMVLRSEEVDAMQRRALYDAKRPHEFFQDDRAAKQQAANAEFRALCERWVRPSVNRLDLASQAAGNRLPGTLS